MFLYGLFIIRMARKKLERRIKQIIIRAGNSTKSFNFDSNEKLVMSKEERKRKMDKIKKELSKIRNNPIVEEKKKETVSNNITIYVQHTPIQKKEEKSIHKINDNPAQPSNNIQNSINKSEMNALFFDENGSIELQKIYEDFLCDLF